MPNGPLQSGRSASPRCLHVQEMCQYLLAPEEQYQVGIWV